MRTPHGAPVGVLGPLALVLVLLAPLSPADAEDAEAKAKAELRAYRTHVKDSRDISDDEGWIAFKRRLTSLRALAALDTPAARAGVLKIARSGKRLDDRLLAAQGLARHGDPDTLKALLAAIAKKPHPVITQAAASGLLANPRPEVHAWIAATAKAETDPVALAVLLRAGRARPLPSTTLTAVFRSHADKATGVGLAYDAVQAVRACPDDDATAIVLEAAGHADMRLRLAAADVLVLRPAGETRDGAIRARLADDHALVRFAMLRALGTAKARAFVPEMSERLADDDLRTRKTAHEELKRISGKDFGFDIGAWRRWHAEQGGEAKPGTTTVPSYHGVPLWSNRLAFILDRSGSMRWPWVPSQPTRMEVAQAELDRVLSVLPKGTHFNVLAFDGKVAAWHKAEAVADKKTTSRARAWARKQESKKGANTNTYEVLSRTLQQNPTIDTIYLLSDGIPEWGDVICHEGLEAAIHDWNRYRRITIHTFCVTHMGLNPGRYPRTASMNRAQSFMKAVASLTGGRYTLVRPPAK